MTEKQVLILCDQIQTGKTSAINESLPFLKPCMGFICPDIDGSRKMVDVQSMKIHDFQIKKPIYSGDVQIGKFTFLGAAFKMAQNILSSIPSNFTGYVIIDEVGKLELKGSGLEPVLSNFLKVSADKPYKIVLVVRDYLLDEVIAKYELKNIKILNPLNFKKHIQSNYITSE